MKTLAREHDKVEILRRLRQVQPKSAPRWGRMNAHQMVCHLSDSFRMALGERRVSHATSVAHRTIVKWIALYLPLRWPRGILTRPEVDQALGGTKPADFLADLAQLETLIGLITAPQRNVDRPPHPIFGRLSDAEWLRWGYLHTDHHLRQFGA